MMPEHDPQPAGGSKPERGLRRERAPEAVDGVVHLPTRADGTTGARPADAGRSTGEATSDNGHDADPSVVDLRAHTQVPPPTAPEPAAEVDAAGDGDRAEPATGTDPTGAELATGARVATGAEATATAVPERRSPEVVTVTPPAPVVEPVVEPLRSVPPSTSLAHRVLRVMAPVLVVVLLAGAVAGVAVARAGAAGAQADTWHERAAQEAAQAASLDELWAALLATVAAGVGESLPQVERVPELAASLGDGAADEQDVPAGSARELAVDAARARAEFATDVRSAVERSDGSPLELGDELASLERAHRSAVEASQSWSERARQEAVAASDRARAAQRIALVAILAGLAVAAAMVELARRRLRAGLDQPFTILVDQVGAVGSDVEPSDPPVRGFPELGWLVVELRYRLRLARSRAGLLQRRAEWGEQSRRIFEALDLAEDEPATYGVLQRALGAVAADRPGELLLAERGSTVLHRVAANPRVPAPGCPVGTTVGCVALRRGQVSVFDSSRSINACPQLADRPGGPCAAACVPVTVAGRPVGVLHVTGEEHAPPTSEVVEQMVVLATQAGTRLAALRALESSRQEASTDGLTGLPNRRTLQAQIAELFERDTPFIAVLADLDRFKLLNDNYGHEMGDRALQLFAGVLRDNVRGNDVVARLGGEEFVLVYPNMSVEISLEAIDRVRAALARALESSPVPDFTCSFGIAHSSVGHDGDAVLRVADAGMLQAKDLGGDQAVVADAELAAEIFAEDSPLRERRPRR